MKEKDDRALGQLRGAVEDLDGLARRLWTRMQQGDIPWDAGSEIGAEFCEEIRDVRASVDAAERALSASLAEAQP